MHRLLSRTATVLTLAATARVTAADDSWVRVLVPVYAAEPVAGVNGSSWTTDLSVQNGGDDVVSVDHVLWDCMLPECGNLPAPLEPGRTFRPRVVEEGSLKGLLLYVAAADADHVGFGLRFRDLSRQSSTWGTELPVPRDGSFRETRFSLLDVPVDPGFRQTLRIYELDGTERAASVRVRVFGIDTTRVEPTGGADLFLGETEIPLQFTPLFGNKPYHPGYAEVTDLSTLAPLGDAERLRLEIEPVTSGLRLWAFVTVIHNETQHATVITPQ